MTGELWTIRRCAEHWDMSVDQMRVLIDQHQVPKIRTGSRGVRIDPDDLVDLKRRLKALATNT